MQLVSFLASFSCWGKKLTAMLTLINVSNCMCLGLGWSKTDVLYVFGVSENTFLFIVQQVENIFLSLISYNPQSAVLSGFSP
jgi:hypothetical protein